MGIRIACGSWSDDAYRGVLYPPGLKPADRLRSYAEIFSNAEINSSYYGTPKPDAVKRWIDETPPGFLFDIKLHRVFSQSPAKAAISPKDLLGYMLENLQPLIEAKKMGVFLLLLPGRYRPAKHSVAELDSLVERLAPFPLAVEMRDPAWVEGPQREMTLQGFRERQIIWVSVDMPVGPEFVPALDVITRRDCAYIRLHGRNRQGYLEGESAADQHAYLYNDVELDGLAERIRLLSAQAGNVRVVTNNHAQDFAPRSALALMDRLRDQVQPWGDQRRQSDLMQSARKPPAMISAASAAPPVKPITPTTRARAASAKKKPANPSTVS